jgi:hypothetical protein
MMLSQSKIPLGILIALCVVGGGEAGLTRQRLMSHVEQATTVEPRM